MAKRRRKLKTKKLIGTLLVLVLLGFIGWGAYYVADTIRLFNKSKTELPSDPSDIGIVSQPEESPCSAWIGGMKQKPPGRTSS